MQPRRRHRRAARHLPRRRREPPLLRRAVHLRPRAAGARPHPRPRQRRAIGRAGPRRRLHHRSTSTSSTAAPARPSTTGAARSTTPSRFDPPHVSAYALTVEAGTPLAADPDRHPDDDDQADKYLAATERLGAAGLDWYEISNWAKPGPRVPPQPPLLDDGRVPGHRLRRPLPPRRPPLLEPAHPRPLPRRRRARRLRRRPPTSASTTTPAPSRPSSSASAPATACPTDALDGRRPRRPGRAPPHRPRPRRPHRARAASSPTRSPSACTLTSCGPAPTSRIALQHGSMRPQTRGRAADAGGRTMFVQIIEGTTSNPTR